MPVWSYLLTDRQSNCTFWRSMSCILSKLHIDWTSILFICQKFFTYLQLVWLVLCMLPYIAVNTWDCWIHILLTLKDTIYYSLLCSAKTKNILVVWHVPWSNQKQTWQPQQLVSSIIIMAKTAGLDTKKRWAQCVVLICTSPLQFVMIALCLCSYPYSYR